MSFFDSSSNVRIEQSDNGYILRASCQNGNGESVESELNMDEHLGNNGGQFERNSGGFGQSAQLVRMEGPEIVCLLNNNDGGMNEVRINLNDFVGNDNGQLYIVQ